MSAGRPKGTGRADRIMLKMLRTMGIHIAMHANDLRWLIDMGTPCDQEELTKARESLYGALGHLALAEGKPPTHGWVADRSFVKDIDNAR